MCAALLAKSREGVCCVLEPLEVVLRARSRRERALRAGGNEGRATCAVGSAL